MLAHAPSKARPCHEPARGKRFFVLVSRSSFKTPISICDFHSSFPLLPLYLLVTEETDPWSRRRHSTRKLADRVRSSSKCRDRFPDGEFHLIELLRCEIVLHVLESTENHVPLLGFDAENHATLLEIDAENHATLLEFDSENHTSPPMMYYPYGVCHHLWEIGLLGSISTLDAKYQGDQPSINRLTEWMHYEKGNSRVFKRWFYEWLCISPDKLTQHE